MKKQHLLFATFILAGSLTVSGQTSDTADSLSAQRTLTIDEVVVTGTRHQTDIRHLSQTVSVVNRKRIEQSMQPSLLPVLTEQVPGLFTTSRGVMGYGVSNGAAGGISLRGLSGGNAVTRNFAASLFRNIKYFTLRKLYLCRKWMQKRLQKTTTTGITLPNFDFLA